MRERAVLSRNEIVISGISTHNKAQEIVLNIRDIVESKGRNMVVFLEGSPGPFGEGICLRISIKGDPLNANEVRSLAKYLSIAGFDVHY
ncbi:MAG: hypothetical protein QXS06_01105 [Desulfurococcaceae archaeon]